MTRARRVDGNQGGTLALQIRLAGLPEPTQEHRFHPIRRWRFDFAYPEHMLAIEVEGGTWVNGRHNRPASFERDCVKYNEATLLGWRLLRFTTAQVESGEALKYIELALNA